jgi:hypothetical protein
MLVLQRLNRLKSSADCAKKPGSPGTCKCRETLQRGRIAPEGELFPSLVADRLKSGIREVHVRVRTFDAEDLKSFNTLHLKVAQTFRTSAGDIDRTKSPSTVPNYPLLPVQHGQQIGGA